MSRRVRIEFLVLCRSRFLASCVCGSRVRGRTTRPVLPRPAENRGAPSVVFGQHDGVLARAVLLDEDLLLLSGWQFDVV